jgi:hypothetical protein
VLQASAAAVLTAKAKIDAIFGEPFSMRLCLTRCRGARAAARPDPRHHVDAATPSGYLALTRRI